MGVEVIGSLLLKSCVDLLCGVLEPKSGQCPTAVENILPGPIGKAPAKRAQQLQASGTDGSPDEDLERLVLVHQWSMSSTHHFLTLKKAGSTVKIMVFDFFCGDRTMVDFCRHRHTPAALVNIQGMDIKRVTSDWYLKFLSIPRHLGFSRGGGRHEDDSSKLQPWRGTALCSSFGEGEIPVKICTFPFSPLGGCLVLFALLPCFTLPCLFLVSCCKHLILSHFFP